MLSIKNLTHTYPNGVQALKSLSLDIPRGMFGLLGPNGAGKSSLMRTLATLQTPTSGEIRFNDKDILVDPMYVRQRLGYLPQDFGVYPRGSAYELLDHLAMLKGVIDKRSRKHLVENLLVKTNLFDAQKKAVATFSGGMRQRFGIAQALIGSPELIIVDEPTAGLDPEERNRFHNLLAEIGQDIVVILSTHIVDDVAQLCPNMAVLAGGEIVAKGTPSDLVAELEGHIWQKAISKSELAQYKSRFHILSDHLCAGKMMIRIASQTPPGYGFEATSANLEDVYFMATSSKKTDLSANATSSEANIRIASGAAS